LFAMWHFQIFSNLFKFIKYIQEVPHAGCCQIFDKTQFSGLLHITSSRTLNER